MQNLVRLERAFGWLLQAIPIGCLVALLVILAGNILARYFQIWSIAWFDEIVEGLFAWMVFFGAAALWRRREHFEVDWLAHRLRSARAKAWLDVAIWSLSLVFLAVMTWYGWQLTANNNALTPILEFPVAWLYVCIPASGTVMCGYTLYSIARTILNAVGRGT